MAKQPPETHFQPISYRETRFAQQVMSPGLGAVPYDSNGLNDGPGSEWWDVRVLVQSWPAYLTLLGRSGLPDFAMPLLQLIGDYAQHGGELVSAALDTISGQVKCEFDLALRPTSQASMQPCDIDILRFLMIRDMLRAYKLGERDRALARLASKLPLSGHKRRPPKTTSTVWEPRLFGALRKLTPPHLVVTDTDVCRVFRTDAPDEAFQRSSPERGKLTWRCELTGKVPSFALAIYICPIENRLLEAEFNGLAERVEWAAQQWDAWTKDENDVHRIRALMGYRLNVKFVETTQGRHPYQHNFVKSYGWVPAMLRKWDREWVRLCYCVLAANFKSTPSKTDRISNFFGRQRLRDDPRSRKHILDLTKITCEDSEQWRKLSGLESEGWRHCIDWVSPRTFNSIVIDSETELGLVLLPELPMTITRQVPDSGVADSKKADRDEGVPWGNRVGFNVLMCSVCVSRDATLGDVLSFMARHGKWVRERAYRVARAHSDTIQSTVLTMHPIRVCWHQIAWYNHSPEPDIIIDALKGILAHKRVLQEHLHFDFGTKGKREACRFFFSATAKQYRLDEGNVVTVPANFGPNDFDPFAFIRAVTTLLPHMLKKPIPQ